MTEIKRSRAGQSYLNKPIGVVNVTTGAEKVYEAKAQTAQTFGNISFDLAKDMQVKEGIEYAKEVLVEDENGLRGYQKVPAHLGSYGRAEANRIYQKRYTDALQNDVRNFAKELRQVEQDPAKYEELYNDYVKQTLLDIDKSGGADVASLIAPSLYDAGKLHVNDMQAKILQQKEDQSKLDYLSILNMRRGDLAGLSGQDLLEAKTSLTNDIEQSAIADYGFSPIQVNDMLNNVDDEYALSVFNDEAKDLSPVALIALQDRKQWDNEVVAETFKETIKVIENFDATRLSEFNARVSAIANDRKTFEGKIAGIARVEEGLKTGRLINDKDTRSSLNSIVGYQTPFDALNPSPDQSNKEDNSPIPSEAYYTLAKAAHTGFSNPEDIVSFAQRLAQTDAVLNLNNRGLKEYFGGDLGNQMEALLSLTKSAGRMGQEELVRVYQQRNERNSLENIEVAKRNADYDGDEKASLDTIARFYIDTNLSDLPPTARAEAVKQVGYMLTFGSPGDISAAVKDFAGRAYKPSEFYEPYSENNSYSKYINGPEVYMQGEELNVFRAHMNTIGKPSNADRFLEPLQSSATNATWAVYELDARGSQNRVLDGNGRPAILYSRNYKKAYAAQRDSRIDELNLMRRQAFSPATQTKQSLKSPMRIID